MPKLPPRRPDSHKGDYGRALLIGGSWGMAGAIALSGMACLRSGAGLVRLAIPSSILGTVAGFEPSYMTLPLTSSASTGQINGSAAQRELTEHLRSATAITIGPGMGQNGDLTQLVLWVYRTATQPVVVDADALNALASLPDGLAEAGGPRILTPHPGEYWRLSKLPGGARRRDELAASARQTAKRYGLIIVLKGNETLIADGVRNVINTTGNPGMATGGSGDVLTGIITALVCQGLSPFDAAVLGAHVHGLAGDLAAAELGQVSLIASDLVRYLPKAFQAVSDYA
ncbi:MAG: NAD(P)H-hydrate dehydratase [Pirellulaceae bacterium]|nr:NAD(P)H-hydrate dehydratase [Pirellulaceae bacterium]